MKLAMPPLYVRASVISSCVAMLFGLDTGSIGPVTTMPSFEATFGHVSPTMHGVIVSSVLIPGALTALVAGVLADRFGHVRLFSLGALIYAVGAALECAAPVLGLFIFGRLVKGVGEGLFLSNVYVQVSEMAPARRRGVMTALPQFLIVTGLVLGFFMCYGTARLGPSTIAWRLPLAVASALGFALSSTYFLVPPSPRWLLSKGRFDEARAVAVRLGLDEAERADLLDNRTHEVAAHANATLLNELQHTASQISRGLVSAIPQPYPPLAASSWPCSSSAASTAFSTTRPFFLPRLALTATRPLFLASGVSALVILAVTIPATFLADKWGRRTSSLVGGVAISAIMLVMGSLYAADEVHADRGAGKWIVIVSIFLFAIVYSGTWPSAFEPFLLKVCRRRRGAAHPASPRAPTGNVPFSLMLPPTPDCR
ncbi:ATINT2 [Verticillium alfalfae VaMs.102]|uniref:ATINT2 n=1 Tax=Verticillium alfalfae (strain VaMs.102 / ATCC MYA-4576 / FGSC 10136) TaxID=526221 RepID=C9SIU4_VERA1|nr:ATINT2 [Verticillium alfalfae VaMs.102]EEY18867.1 ATINT2 [Verticillium alfalfae VaMs.102]